MNVPVHLTPAEVDKIVKHSQEIDLGVAINDILDEARIQVAKLALAVRYHFYIQMQDEEYYAKTALKPEDVIGKDGVSRYALIDRDGLAWFYQRDPESDYEEDEGMAWVRQSQEMLGGQFLVGPTIERDVAEDWDSLLQYGPLRIATDEDDLSWKYVYHVGGYDNGRPIGPEVHLNEEEHARLVMWLYEKERAEDNSND